MPGSVESIARQLAIGLSSIGQLVSVPQGPGALLAMLGWSLPAGTTDIGLAALDLSDLATQVLSFDASVSAGSGGASGDLQYAKILEALGQALSAVESLSGGFSAPADYLSATQLESQFLPRLFDFLVSTTLASASPVATLLAQFTGVITIEQHDADPGSYQLAHLRPVVHWDRLGQMFTAPVDRLRAEYGWGTAAFDADRLIANIGALIERVGVPGRSRALPARVEAQLAGGTAPAADAPALTQLFYSFALGTDSAASLGLGVSLFPLRASAAGSDGGLALSPYLFGSGEATVALTDNLSVVFDITAEVDSGIAVQLRPGQGPSITSGLMASTGPAAASGHVLVGLQYADPSGAPVTLLSVDEGLIIQAGSVSLSAGADVTGGVLGILAQIELDKGSFQLSTAKLDSFLAALIPIDVNMAFALKFGWSSVQGLFIEGNASPHFDISINQSVGPFTLDMLHIVLTLGQPDLPLELSLDGSASLGPLDISVQRLGLTADLSFHNGNLGPVDLQLGFKPPTGLGIQIDAGLASGGGFISFDPAQGRYAGVLDVTIVDLIAVKVIAVLDTKLPDGSDGFSFLLIITFEFPPIQLGLGFTLSGVGGLGGINRTMVIDALQAGLRAHTLDDILFPPDPVADATKIISEIEAFFPPQQGRYLFGPMLSIGWGTPTLLDLEVGVILEVPDPIRLAILGEIKASIPSPDFPLISLKIQVLGTIDFGLQKLAIDGTMYDSYLLLYQLGGDMALRLNWGASPNFLFSLGGFNPHFTPPPDVPALARMSVSLGSGDNPRLASSSYLAVTSNSLQFGANVDAYAEAGGFAVHGYIGFDALFIFSPFSFEFDFAAGFTITYDGTTLAGITLTAMLAGPTPWHLHGDASLTFLFFTVSASIDLTWGDSNQATLPPAAVLPALTGALGDPRNWSAQLPPAGDPGVSLRSITADPAVIVVQPCGVLQVREIVVPLDIPITKFVNAVPTDGSQFGVTDVTLNGKPVAAVPQQEDFAIAQFTDMSDADKVSAPSYELFDAGVRVGALPLQNGKDAPRTIQYVTKIIDDYEQRSRLTAVYTMPANVHSALTNTRVAAATATTGLRAFAPADPAAIAVKPASYVIASTLDLTVRADVLDAATTYYQARAALSAFLTGHPEERDNIQVIAAHEAVPA